MKRGVLVLWIFALACSAIHSVLGRPGFSVFEGTGYTQAISNQSNAAHADWNPGTGACPLNPTNAVALAIGAATNAFPNTFADERFAKLSLHAADRNTVWHYNVSLLLHPLPEQGIVKQGGWVSIIVQLDGTVPPIKKGEPVAARRFGGGFRSRPPDSPVVPRPSAHSSELSPEEQEKRRAEIRKNLKEYQMEVIRSGMPPLPVPLTREMDDQLVQEGVLPPAKPKLTPEEQERRREEIRKNLQELQMQVIRQGMPMASVRLTLEQKEQLEKEGFVFLSNGSISNSVTGFCHPPRPELIPQ